MALSGLYWRDHRDDPPWPEVLDLAEGRWAGKFDRVQAPRGQTGVLKSRVGAESPWVELPLHAEFQAPSDFRIESGVGYVELVTAGNFIIGLDAAGAPPADFSFLGARTNVDRNVHSALWSISSGRMRIKSSEMDRGARHFVEVRTPSARLILEDGEVGISIPNEAKASGQFWVVKGSVVVRWKDGRRGEYRSPGLQSF